MIINLRGTNGSGKSFITKKLLLEQRAVPIYGELGGRKPVAYEFLPIGCKKTVYVIGPYNTPCGGCDAIIPFEMVPEIIERYAKLGNVIFEGLLISTFYGVIGSLLERWKDQAVFLYLDTPLEVCIERVNARREKRDNKKDFNPKLLTDKYGAILKTKAKVEAGGMRAMMVSGDNAIETIKKLLRGAK